MSGPNTLALPSSMVTTATWSTSLVYSQAPL